MLRLIVASRPRPSNNPGRGSKPSANGAIVRCMKVEEIAEAIAKLPPDQFVRFRRWFTAFEAGRADHAKELDSTATKIAVSPAVRSLKSKKRANEP